MQKETYLNAILLNTEERKSKSGVKQKEKIKILEGLPEAEKIRFQLKVAGYSLAGNIDKDNEHILKAMVEYMDENNILYKVEKAFNIWDSPLENYKALWIDIVSFNKSKAVKKNIFIRKKVKTAQEAFYLMKDKLNLVPVLRNNRSRD